MRRYSFDTSSLALLYTLFVVSKVTCQDGPFSISISTPSICTSSTYIYSSQKAMPTGSFVIDPGETDMLQLGSKWKFTVNAGIVLNSGGWGDDGQNISKSIVLNGNGSYTFTVPNDGTWRT